MPKMDLIEKSLSIALTAHQGQTDKAGNSYILHPLRIAMNFNDPHVFSAAILHDAVEDSELTFDDLLAGGIPSVVVDAVKVLTKQSGVEYEDYLSLVKRNEIAAQVKLKDIEDNLNVLRLNELTSKDLSRVQKYHHAHKFLSG